MEISGIPPLSIAASILPRTVPPLQQAASYAAVESLTQPRLAVSPASSRTVPAVETGQQLLASLEQALFRDLLGNLPQAGVTSIAPDLEQILAGQLGLPATAGVDLLPLSFQASFASSMPLASLFETIQMLGGAGGEEPTTGSLLDLLA